MKESAEVTVIGGGVTGCSIAYYLAKEGVKVALVERGELASGASGACVGGVLAGTTSMRPETQDMVLQSIKLYSSLAKDLEYDIQYERTGIFFVFESEDQWAPMRKIARDLEEKGVRTRLIEQDELRKEEPALSDSVIGALNFPDDGIVTPMRTCHGFALAAKKLGAEINTFTEVKGIDLQNRTVRSVLTSKGSIKTDLVVDAAGAWAPFIAEMVGLKLPMDPHRGIQIVSERLPFFHWRFMNQAEIVTKGLTRPKDKKSIGQAFALVQYGEGNCLIGTSADFAGYDNRVSPELFELILKHAVHYVPRLRNVNFIRSYAGLRPYSEDGIPIWGMVDTVNGFILATGQGGNGNALAPITGKLISELITKGKTSMSIDKMRYSRFDQLEHSS